MTLRATRASQSKIYRPEADGRLHVWRDTLIKRLSAERGSAQGCGDHDAYRHALNRDTTSAGRVETRSAKKRHRPADQIRALVSVVAATRLSA